MKKKIKNVETKKWMKIFINSEKATVEFLSLFSLIIKFANSKWKKNIAAVADDD